jgi:DNA-binding SARP family transcriptional activator
MERQWRVELLGRLRALQGDLVRLYVVQGQHAAARRQYQELERLLKKDLGAALSPATRALAREIELLAALHP